MMRSKVSRLRGSLAIFMTLGCTGCAHSPSFNVLGSYFPGWIACIVLSILLTMLVRAILHRTDMEQRLPALPLFYFSVALLIACVIWLVSFE